MKNTIFLCVVILILLISVANAELSSEKEEAKKALSPCSSGSLTTSVHKRFQMTYTDEDFIQIDNIGLLKDVSQLKDLTCLQYMDATDKTIKGDIANLKNLMNLEVFSLYSNPDVSGDICSLAGATNLRSLKFAFDPKITGDISCLKGLNKLETFAMTHTQVSGDLSVFANMPNLKAIYVSGTNIEGDICALSKLTNLEELGIADEYPGNPDITGDLSCLDNLKKINKVSLYNTNATNCEQFTKSHPNIEQGGCSKESLKTLVDYGQKYEKKIGKEVQTEVRGQPNYQQDAGFEGRPAGTEEEKQYKEPYNRNFLTKFIDWIKNLFGRTLDRSYGVTDQPSQSEDANQIRPQVGPGGCKSQAECDTFCDKPENKESCSKFAPPDSTNGKGEESDARPNFERGELGGCKSRAECEAYCSKPENREACSKFSHRGEEPQVSGQQSTPSQDTAKASKPACRVSILPASKGTAPYEARVCVDNPDEVIQQNYQDYVDFDGDGSWDYQGSVHGCHAYTFQKSGTFSPKAKILDSKGIESDICQKTVIVN